MQYVQKAEIAKALIEVSGIFSESAKGKFIEKSTNRKKLCLLKNFEDFNGLMRIVAPTGNFHLQSLPREAFKFLTITELQECITRAEDPDVLRYFNMILSWKLGSPTAGSEESLIKMINKLEEKLFEAYAFIDAPKQEIRDFLVIALLFGNNKSICSQQIKDAIHEVCLKYIALDPNRA